MNVRQTVALFFSILGLGLAGGCKPIAKSAEIVTKEGKTVKGSKSVTRSVSNTSPSAAKRIQFGSGKFFTDAQLQTEIEIIRKMRPNAGETKIIYEIGGKATWRSLENMRLPRSEVTIADRVKSEFTEIAVSEARKEDAAFTFDIATGKLKFKKKIRFGRVEIEMSEINLYVVAGVVSTAVYACQFESTQAEFPDCINTAIANSVDSALDLLEKSGSERTGSDQSHAL